MPLQPLGKGYKRGRMWAASGQEEHFEPTRHAEFWTAHPYKSEIGGLPGGQLWKMINTALSEASGVSLGWL